MLSPEFKCGDCQFFRTVYAQEGAAPYPTIIIKGEEIQTGKCIAAPPEDRRMQPFGLALGVLSEITNCRREGGVFKSVEQNGAVLYESQAQKRVILPPREQVQSTA